MGLALLLTGSGAVHADAFTTAPGYDLTTVVDSFQVMTGPGGGATMVGGVAAKVYGDDAKVFVTDVTRPNGNSEGLYTVTGTETYTFNQVQPGWNAAQAGGLTFDAVTGQLLSLVPTDNNLSRIDQDNLNGNGNHPHTALTHLYDYPPGVGDGGVTYAGTDGNGDHILYAVERKSPNLWRMIQDADTGAILSTTNVSPASGFPADPIGVSALDDGTLLVSSYADGNIYEIDPDNGHASSVWLDLQTSLGYTGPDDYLYLGQMDVNPVTGDVYIVGLNPDHLISINPDSLDVTNMAWNIGGDSYDPNGYQTFLSWNSIFLGPELGNPDELVLYASVRETHVLNYVPGVGYDDLYYETGLQYLTIPEPGTVGVILLGCFTLLRRRRTA